MIQKEIRSWKKVFETDLTYIAYELKEIVPGPALIILEGPLGGGKTTFSKVFIDGDETISPTYSVLSDTHNVLHGDFYRIKDREEIIHLELPLYLEDKKYFLVEWGKKHFQSISKELPEDYECYLLEVSINEMTDKDGPQSRNFVLFEVKED
jgi:tRNA threonylcarbamoyladenosine biosynthesis protein TsaE